MAKEITFVGKTIKTRFQDTDKVCVSIGSTLAKNEWAPRKAQDLAPGDKITLDGKPDKVNALTIDTITTV